MAEFLRPWGLEPLLPPERRCLNRLTMGAYIDKLASPDGEACLAAELGFEPRQYESSRRCYVTPFRIICFYFYYPIGQKHYSGKSLVCQYFLIPFIL